MEKKMKITKATYEGPDSDNTLNFEMEASLENTTESVIELIKTNVLFVNSDGVCVCGNQEDEHEVFIDANGTESINVNCGWNNNATGFNGKLDNIKAILDTQLYRREFHNLGNVKIPGSHEEAAFFTKGIDIAGLVQILGATCTRKKTDEDGEVDVGFVIGIRNVSDQYFDRVQVNFTLNDQAGAEIDRTEDYHPLPPQTGRVFEPSLYRLKPGRLRNCVGKLTVHIFQPVAYHSATTILTKAE